MAKQNVTYLERHLEKFVIAGCGAVLLAVVYLYLVASPHSVTVNGVAMGPRDFYEQFKTKGEQELLKLKTAQPPADQKPIDATAIINPKTSEKIPGTFVVAVGYPSPAVPQVAAGVHGQVELAQLL